MVKPENILVSTRQPGLLKDLSSRYNVRIVFDNEQVVAGCDIIFVSCLPLQFDGVVPELRKSLKSRTQRKPLIISVLAGLTAAKVTQTVFSGSASRSAGILTTKVNTKRLRMALAREGGNIGKQKIATCLVRMYKKISGTQTARMMAPQEEDKRAETPSSCSEADEERYEDEDVKIVREFMMREAASGLASKSGEDVVQWIKEYGIAFPGLGAEKIAETVLGAEYTGTGIEKLLE